MNVISIIMLVFAMLGALDRILGDRFGLGKEFEKGFNLLGAMALSMIGMITITPLIAELLRPCFDGLYNLLGIDPSILPASILANAMGGDPLSREMMKDERVGMLHALVTSSMMGCTISFTIPYALGVVKQERHKELFLGILCGIVTIPLGCFVAGLFMGISVLTLLYNLLPLFLFAGILAAGLLLVPNGMIKVFSGVGVFMRVIITAGLALGVFQELTGIILIKQLDSIWTGADVCFRAAMTLCGAFPFMYVVSQLLKKPLSALGKIMKINETAAMGLLSTIVSNAPTLEMVNRMDTKGAVINSAFLVSAAFVLGGHLAYTTSIDPNYIFPMMLGKIVAGVSSVFVALFIYKRTYKEA